MKNNDKFRQFPILKVYADLLGFMSISSNLDRSFKLQEILTNLKNEVTKFNFEYSGYDQGDSTSFYKDFINILIDEYGKLCNLSSEKILEMQQDFYADPKLSLIHI